MDPVKLLQIGKWSQVKPKVARYISIDPNDPKYKGKIVIVSGVLGQGKTHIFTELKDTGGIITVNPRRSVLKEFTIRTNQIDWTWYEQEYLAKKPKGVSRYELVNARNLAICNLSTWRLQNKEPLENWNTAIFDEFALTYVSNVSKDAIRKKEIREVQDYLIGNTETVWVLGWLFDDPLLNYIESFGREIIWEKWHWPILKDKKFELCDSERQLLGSTAIDIKNGGGALVVSEKSNSISKIYTNLLEKHIPNVEPKICNTDNRLTEEEVIRYHDKNTNAEERLHITSPVNSVGTDYQEKQWDTTTLHFTNQTPKLGGTDIVQFALRNRMVQTFKWFPSGEEKNLIPFNDFAVPQVLFSETDRDDFGAWNPNSGTRVIDVDCPLAITQQYVQKKKAYELKFRKQIAWHQFKMLGLKDENIYRSPHTDLSEFSWTSHNQHLEELLSSQYLETNEYFISNDHLSKRYTDICNAFGTKNITKQHYYRYDNGNYENNRLRRKQMFDDYIVRQEKSKASIHNRKWNSYQHWIGKFIEQKMNKQINQMEFQMSEVWQHLLKNKTAVNLVMDNLQLSELRITVDDKVKPLHWLKKYLTKHDFDCVLEAPDKSRLKEIRAVARKENRAEFEKWRGEQKELFKKGSSYKGLQNYQIDHFLAFKLESNINDGYKPLSDSLSQLSIVKSDYILTIKDYD